MSERPLQDMLLKLFAVLEGKAVPATSQAPVLVTTRHYLSHQ
jgi:hypothetical protein